MPSALNKKDIADFFRPHARPVVPQKRRSSTVSSERPGSQQEKPPKTPNKNASFKNVTPVSRNSLPIRSPRTTRITDIDESQQNQLTKNNGALSRQEFDLDISFTFSDVSGKGQKIFENGKVVGVKDSDDDTDSLESLDDIFGRKKDAAITSDSSPPEDLEAKKVKTLSIFTSGRSVPIVGKEKLRALYAKEKAVKFDLSKVLDDHFGEEETEQKISSLRAELDAAEENVHNCLDKDLLASIAHGRDGDQEDVERLLHAVERTEALSSDRIFSFFYPRELLKEKPSRSELYPETAISKQLWSSANSDERDQVFLSGFMAGLAHTGELDHEALRWVLYQVVEEQRPELRRSYVHCLQASSSTWTRLNVSAADVQLLFQSLNSDPGILRDSALIESHHQPLVQSLLKPDYRNLLSTLQTFQAICPDMDFAALSKLSSILLRLVLDSAVMSDNQICLAAETLFEKLLGLPDEEASSHVYDRMLTDATQNLRDPQLQAQLLAHLIPTTSRSTRLRKTLADVFLLGASTIDTNTNASQATLESLTEHISTSPLFSLTRHANSSPIDYTALTSLTRILDIAIPGTPPPPSILESTISPTTSFDASIDVLADKLHTLFISIKDTGASHMRRTECKDALQALYFRLLFSVRIKPRKKKHVFDGSGKAKRGESRWVDGEEWRQRERGSGFMKKYLGAN